MDVANSKPRDRDVVMEVDVPLTDLESHSEDQLEQKPLNLAASASRLSLEGLLEEAHRSARLCSCEGRQSPSGKLELSASSAA